MKVVRMSQKFNHTVTKAGWNFRKLRKRISKMMTRLPIVKQVVGTVIREITEKKLYHLIRVLRNKEMKWQKLTWLGFLSIVLGHQVIRLLRSTQQQENTTIEGEECQKLSVSVSCSSHCIIMVVAISIYFNKQYAEVTI